MLFSLEALKKEGFIRIMKGVLSSMSEEMLELLFLKVDSDCNGFVTWVRRVPCSHRKLGEVRKSGPVLSGASRGLKMGGSMSVCTLGPAGVLAGREAWCL